MVPQESVSVGFASEECKRHTEIFLQLPERRSKLCNTIKEHAFGYGLL